MAAEGRDNRIAGSCEDIFYSLCDDFEQDTVSVKTFLAALEETGLQLDDVRLRETMDILNSRPEGAGPLTLDEFRAATAQDLTLISKALTGSFIIPDWQEFCSDIREIFEQCATNSDGENADYIPSLAGVDSSYWGVSVCSVDGQRFSLGDSTAHYTVQSSSKPITYCMAMEENSEEVVHSHIGREPSGRNFNELTLNPDGFPHNPFINAGAIMAVALTQRGKEQADRFSGIEKVWRQLTGGIKCHFNLIVFSSEKATADRNYALAYMMKEKGAFPEGSNLSEDLDLYFQCCSIETNVYNHACIAATIANFGQCPTTGERVFQEETCKSTLSLMFSCGMYDYSGEFAYKIGIPAKSGVSGVIIGCIPGVCGFATFSPRIDAAGNSVRGVEFCQRLVEKFPSFHNFGSMDGFGKNPVREMVRAMENKVIALLFAAAEGNLREVQRLAALGIPLDAPQFDFRTALHVAASEGQFEIVDYLVRHGVKIDPVDRWGGTPIQDAVRGGHTEVAQYLQKALDHRRLSSLETNEPKGLSSESRAVSGSPLRTGQSLSSRGMPESPTAARQR